LLVGVKDALVLVFMLLFFGTLYAILSATPHVGGAREGALVLKLDGSIVEQPVQPSAFDLVGDGPMTREYRLRDVVNALDTAATDGRVKAVVLDLDSFLGGGQAALSDVAAAIDRVRKSNKPVIAYATGYTDSGYQLASHASEIWLNPLGAVLITGRGGNNLYFKGLLDKLGVTANVYRAGAFKSAVEPYTRTDMSPEAREAARALSGALWENWQQEVRKARPKAEISAYAMQPLERITASGGDMAKAAIAARLVDKLGDRIAFGKRVAEIVGAEDEKIPGSFKGIKLDAWIADNPASDPGGQIGILTVAGTIVDGEAGPGTAGAETIVQNLERGMKDKDLKALVLRVDSPGGSTLGSERIRQAVLQAKSRGLPVVVSMGSVAASGGYWVSMPADHIFAEPETITGSIGVFGIIPSFEGTVQKLGVGVDGVQTTPLTGEPDLLRGPSPVADSLIQLGIDNTYKRFIALVSASRKLPPARVAQIAQGRVWDGGTARQVGLIDGFGSLDAAVAEAARRAKLDPGSAKTVDLEPEPDFVDRLFSGMAGGSEVQPQSRDAFGLIGTGAETLLMRGLLDAQSILSGPAIQARCLECPASTTPLRKKEKATLSAWLAGLFAR
jgi:protease-4